MADEIMTAAECATLRQECIARIQANIDSYLRDRDWTDALSDWLTGSTPTVQKVLNDICCRGTGTGRSGCDCDQIKQYVKDQDAVIAKLEAYIGAGNFATFPMATPLATSGPAGMRPAEASCCIRRIIDLMEEWFRSGADSPIEATGTLYQGIYLYAKMIGHVLISLGLTLIRANPFNSYVVKKSFGVDITDINHARAEIELGRSRVFRDMLRRVYALCCCES
jgi:hypothetical protein